MTINEILKREPEKILEGEGITEVGHIFDINHGIHPFKELDKEIYLNHRLNLEKNKKIKIKVLKDFWYDSRRMWGVVIFNFEDVDFMIYQYAGREGDDSNERFMLNLEIYEKCLDYLISDLFVFDKHFYPEIKVYENLDEDIKKLGNFYGGKLDDYFERY